MDSFWILATCECGLLVRADIDFCLYCIGGYVFVNHAGCGAQLTAYHADHCPRRGAAFEPPTKDLEGHPYGDPATE